MFLLPSPRPHLAASCRRVCCRSFLHFLSESEYAYARKGEHLNAQWKSLALASAFGSLIWTSSSLADTVDYWRFEEGSGTLVSDQTGLANGMANPTNWSSDVPYAMVPQTGQPDNTSLHFIPFHDVILSPTSDLNYGSNFTVECFFKLDKLPNPLDHFGFLYFMGDSTNGSFPRLELDINQTSGGSQFDAALNGTTGGVGIYDSSTFSLSVTTWYHMAFVKSGTNFQFFLDGNVVGSGTLNSEQAGSYQFPTGGNYNIGGFFGFNGYLDEVRISNTALPPSQFLGAIPEPSTFALLLVGVASTLFGIQARRPFRCH